MATQVNQHDGRPWPKGVSDIFVIVSEYDGEDLEIKCYPTLGLVEDYVHDIIGFGARRVRVYRVFADPEPPPSSQQLSERVKRFDFDAALAAT